MFELEAEMARVEGDRAGDILYLIAHAMHSNDAFVHHNLLRLSPSHIRCRRPDTAHVWIKSKLSGPRTEKRAGTFGAHPSFLRILRVLRELRDSGLCF